MKKSNQNKGKSIRFQYYAEDCDCISCLYYQGKKHGCTLTACCCEDIRNDAIENDRTMIQITRMSRARWIPR